MERKYISVYALNQYIKAKMDQDVSLRSVYIKGEISNYRPHPSGHLYFTLKDKNSRINAIMFASQAKQLDFELENGMQVFIHARVSVYEATGQYQLYVQTIKEDGIGNLYLKFEQLKKKLEKEGLFDISHKKEIPSFPKNIAILSAKQGAAVQDIVRTLHLRFPFVNAIVFPIPVQGLNAYLHIVETLKQVDKRGFDTIILARGGGSIEDLWNFNEEILARCIYDLKTPIITGIGHETDFTICDFVSDYRAVTPTAAAIKATPDCQELKNHLDMMTQSLKRVISHRIEYEKQYLLRLKNHYYFSKPDIYYANEILHLTHLKDRFIHQIELFDTQSQKQIDEYKNSLKIAMNQILFKNEKNLQLNISKLDALSPLKVLQRGYTIIQKENKVIKESSQLNKGDIIDIIFTDDSRKAEIK